MFKLAYRYITENKIRSALTMVGIIVSVGLMLGIMILNDTMLQDFKNNLLRTGGESDLTLVKVSGFSSKDMTWLEDHLDVQNVEREYSISRKLTLENKEKVYLNIHGIEEELEVYGDQLKPIEGQYFGSDKRSFREVILSDEGAKTLGYKVGDIIELETNHGRKPYVISGLYKGVDVSTIGNTVDVYIPIKVLQNDMNVGNHYNKVVLRLNGDKTYIMSAAETVEKEFMNQISVFNNISNYEFAKKNLNSMMFGFNIILIVIFFVASFLIYNTFTIVLMERIKMLGVLKAIGMDKRKTMKLILCESFMMGLIGSVVGIILGIGVGIGLLIFFHSDGSVQIQVKWGAIIVTFISGIVMTMVSAYLPAKKINKISILESLKIGETILNEREKSSFYNRYKGWIGILFILTNFLALYIPEEVLSEDAMMIIMPITMLMLFVGIVMAVPKLLSYSLKGIVPMASKALGFEGVMAGRNILRNEKRSALIQTVIIIGMMVAIGFNGMFHSFRSSAEQYVEDAFNYDLIVTGNFKDIKDISRKIDLIDKSENVDFCTYVRKENFKMANSRGTGVLYGINPVEYMKMLNLEVTEGNRDEITTAMLKQEEQGLLISKYYSDNYGVSIGDSMPVIINNRRIEGRIVGVVDTFINNGKTIFINNENLSRATGFNYFNEMMIKANSFGNVVELEKYIEQTFEDNEVNILQIAEVKKRWRANIVKGTEIFESINFITVLVAIFGLANTLIIAIFERRKEFGMLLSIGADRKSLRNIIVYESCIMGLISIVFGVLGGMHFTNMAAQGMGEVSGLTITVFMPYNFLMMSVVAVVICCFVAALYPAKIAMNLNIVESIKGE